VEKVAALIQAEINLKKQVSDLEKKETAYSKTIQEADTIMARVEVSYQERIKELEQEKHDLKQDDPGGGLHHGESGVRLPGADTGARARETPTERKDLVPRGQQEQGDQTKHSLGRPEGRNEDN